MPKTKKVEDDLEITPTETETPVEETVETEVETPAEAPVEEAVEPEAVDETTENLETRGQFTLFRQGDKYSVKDNFGRVVAPLTSQAEAEQLFRGFTRKF